MYSHGVALEAYSPTTAKEPTVDVFFKYFVTFLYVGFMYNKQNEIKY